MRIASFFLLGMIILGSSLPNSAAAEPVPIEQLRELGWLGAAAADYLEAFRAEDAAGLEAYARKHRDAVSLQRTPAEARAQRQLQIRAMLGAIELAAIKSSEPGELHILVRSPAMGGYFELFFVESESEAGKIGSQGMQPSASPEELGLVAGGSGPDSVGSEAGGKGRVGVDEDLPFSEWLAALRERHAIPALAVAWSVGDDPVEGLAIGVRDLRAEDPVSLEDRFHLGSITKSMTASMIARLVDRGDLSFDLTVGRVFDGAEIHEAYREVTLAMLLQHRAGAEALLDPTPEREAGWRRVSDDPTAQRRQLVREVLARAPEIEPGTAALYSNAGYVVAAAMAERITGQSWEALMVSEVFEPLGLDSMGFGWPSTSGGSAQPRGHWIEQGRPRAREEDGYQVGPALAPAGDVHGSVGDLVGYGRAHLASLSGEENWISTATMERLHALPGDGTPPGFAMGWQLEAGDGVVRHLHAGSAGTFYAFLCLIPAEDLVVAVAMNDGDLTNDVVARRILERLLRGEPIGSRPTGFR